MKTFLKKLWHWIARIKSVDAMIVYRYPGSWCNGYLFSRSEHSLWRMKRNVTLTFQDVCTIPYSIVGITFSASVKSVTSITIDGQEQLAVRPCPPEVLREIPPVYGTRTLVMPGNPVNVSVQF